MRVSIITEDNFVGIDGVFRMVDLSTLEVQQIRAVQWRGSEGHIEMDDGMNIPITSLTPYQQYIDAWNALTPPTQNGPAFDEMKAGALARINIAYEISLREITSGYPQHEIDSWPKQEQEARAWAANSSASTPWLNSAAGARKISKATFASKIITKADLFAVLHGQLTGKRQALEDQINALGPNPAQASLDAIIW